MTTKLRIPKGWRRLKCGESRRAKDKVWAYNEGPWEKIEDYMEGLSVARADHPVIRRKSKTS